MIRTLGQAAQLLGLQGDGDQVAMQAQQEAEDRRKRLNTLTDAQNPLSAVSMLLGNTAGSGTNTSTTGTPASLKGLM